MSRWKLAEDASPAERAAFRDLDAVFALEGRKITQDPLSQVIYLQVGGIGYYVKRYHGAGKGLRRWIGRPRVKAEWQNLRRFAKWGIPTASLVAWGLERQGGAFARGALVTRELPDTRDMADLARHNDPRLRQAGWVAAISQQLARATRTLHDHHFAHNDLKWRNLLVDGRAGLYFIDCPSGDFWWGPMLRTRIVKDLACLDKLAKRKLSRTQRLRFYLQYRGRKRLNDSDKQRIRQVLAYFEGRE